MAFLSAALPYISLASTALGVSAQIQKSNADQAQLQQLARERKEDANAAQAEAQREAQIERRKAAQLMSRARAVAAASGAGVSDPSIVNIMTDIDTQGEVNALNAMYTGDTTARGFQRGARSAVREARATRQAGYMAATSTALAGAESWYSKYGA